MQYGLKKKDRIFSVTKAISTMRWTGVQRQQASSASESTI